MLFAKMRCRGFQVCDFGLSRQKHNTFLTSKSGAGTVNFLNTILIEDFGVRFIEP